MKTETKIWVNNKALAVVDWIEAHPWPIAMFVAGFVLGKIL